MNKITNRPTVWVIAALGLGSAVVALPNIPAGVTAYLGLVSLSCTFVLARKIQGRTSVSKAQKLSIWTLLPIQLLLTAPAILSGSGIYRAGIGSNFDHASWLLYPLLGPVFHVLLWALISRLLRFPSRLGSARIMGYGVPLGYGFVTVFLSRGVGGLDGPVIQDLSATALLVASMFGAALAVLQARKSKPDRETLQALSSRLGPHAAVKAYDAPVSVEFRRRIASLPALSVTTKKSGSTGNPILDAALAVTGPPKLLDALKHKPDHLLALFQGYNKSELTDGLLVLRTDASELKVAADLRGQSIADEVQQIEVHLTALASQLSVDR